LTRFIYILFIYENTNSMMNVLFNLVISNRISRFQQLFQVCKIITYEFSKNVFENPTKNVLWRSLRRLYKQIFQYLQSYQFFIHLEADKK